MNAFIYWLHNVEKHDTENLCKKNTTVKNDILIITPRLKILLLLLYV